MNKNFATVLIAAIAVGIGTYLYQTTQPQKVAVLDNTMREQIVTNAPGGVLPPVDERAHTILALPENYESDSLSTNLRNGFGSIKLLRAVRANSNFKAYENGQTNFEYLWQGVGKEGGRNYLPEVDQGKAAVVIVSNTGEVIYKAAGKTAETISRELSKLKILDKICPCKPKPKPAPEPDKKPVDDKEPGIPDTVVDEDPAATVEDDDLIQTIIGAALGGLVGWALVFSRKVK